MQMISVGSETKLYGWLSDLTVYSSNLGALKDTGDSLSKVKYRVSRLLLIPLSLHLFLSIVDSSTGEGRSDDVDEQRRTENECSHIGYQREHCSSSRENIDRRDQCIGHCSGEGVMRYRWSVELLRL